MARLSRGHGDLARHGDVEVAPHTLDAQPSRDLLRMPDLELGCILPLFGTERAVQLGPRAFRHEQNGVRFPGRTLAPRIRRAGQQNKDEKATSYDHAACICGCVCG